MSFLFWGLLSGEAIFLLQGGLHIFDIVDFDKYFQYVIVIPYVVLGAASLISLLVQWIVRYLRKKQKARTTPDYQAIHTALEAGHLSEAIRLYKAVNCLHETSINDALGEVLVNVPVEDAIRTAIKELLAFQHDSAGLLRVEAPQDFVHRLEAESEIMLNTMWTITDRVVAVRRQNIDSPKIQKALSIQLQRIKNFTNGVHEARVQLAEFTLRGWDSPDIEKALQNLSYFLTEYRKQLGSGDWSDFSGEGREDTD